MIKTKNDFPAYSLLKNMLLISTDALAYITSMIIALQTRLILPEIFTDLSISPIKISNYFFPEAFILYAIVFIVFVWNSLYQSRHTFWEELLIIWRSLLVSFLITYLFLFNFPAILPFFSRIVMVFLYFFLAIFLPLYRIILKKFLFVISFWRTPMILVCQKEDLEKVLRIAQIFYRDFYLGFVPVAFCIQGSSQKEIFFPPLNLSLPCYSDPNQIPKQSAVCFYGDSYFHDKNVISLFYTRFRKMYLIPSTNSLGFKGSGVMYLFTERLFIITLENKLNSYFAQTIKFLMDRILGFLFCLLLCPLLIILSILVKLFSPGPIFYRQKRIGKGGKTFKIWKFRTMYQDADQKLQYMLDNNPALKQEWDQYFKLKNDPRITPIGRFLRKYSLDEFPQLFNVLSGEMSLIGPRPFVQGEIGELNSHFLDLYAQIKPGLSGLWQVSGRNDIDRIERIDIDMWYIQHWSPALDLLILLNTPWAVLSGRGAS